MRLLLAFMLITVGIHGMHTYVRTSIKGKPIYYNVPAEAQTRQARNTKDQNKIQFRVFVYLPTDNKDNYRLVSNEINKTVENLNQRWRGCVGVNVSLLPRLSVENTFLIITSICPNLFAAETTHRYLYTIHIYPFCNSDVYPGFAILGGTNMWILNAYYKSPELLAHEIGHNLNLKHAGTSFDEYGDSSCAMGACCSTVCFNAPHLDILGWNTKPLVISAAGVYNFASLGPVLKLNDYYFTNQNASMYIHIVSSTNDEVGTLQLDVLKHGHRYMKLNSVDVRFAPEGDGHAVFVGSPNTYPQTYDTDFLYLVPFFIFICIAPFLILVA